MDFVSLIIAILALLVSTYSVYESRKSNRIGHEPVLVGHESESPTEYCYEIKNKGNGSAFFEKVEYFLNLQSLKDKSLKEAIREVLTKNGIRCQTTITNLGQESVMAPGETIVLAKIMLSLEETSKFEAITDAKFAVRILYKSAHGNRKVWASDDRLLNV
jgi:hypothetical protein